MAFNPAPINQVRTKFAAVSGPTALAGLAQVGTIALDGMWGIDWELLMAPLVAALRERGIEPEMVRMTNYLRAPLDLREHFSPWITDNPVFGQICRRPLADYFDTAAAAAAVLVAQRRAGPAGAVLVVGPFALGACTPDLGVYCDLPREEIVRRQERPDYRNLGDDRVLSPAASYKNAYYVEWPLLESHKRRVLVEEPAPVQFYVDCCDERRPVVMARPALLAAVADATSRPFRCKPFFMPGVWGGQRLKEAAGLPEEWPNCAWDFEIVAPENSLIIGTGAERLTIPFHLAMWLQAREIMGELIFRQFGEYFPLRINYLDTMGGTNLSLQVHPHHTYMRQTFGEPIGQDESYYIVEHEPGSRVYLGLKEAATRESLQAAVRGAEELATPFEVTNYVNAWDARVGDLFLIPAGTVHCSGAQNLVLEISSTPYWYTFKIYDYLRPDLDGKPRPINSGHAFAVIDFTRRTEWVRRHLVPTPLLLRSEAGGAEYHLGSCSLTFYGINRLHVETEMTDRTDGVFLLLTVVQGDGVLVSAEGTAAPAAEISYLETFVLPAGFGEFRIRTRDGNPCQVVKTYVKR